MSDKYIQNLKSRKVPLSGDFYASLGQIKNVDELPTGNGGTGGGITVHNSLTGRSASDAHPILAISGLQTALDNKVNIEAGKGLSTNDYTTAEKTKLAGMEYHFKGEYVSKTELDAVVGVAGDYAYVDEGAGFNVVKYIWDSSDNVWTLQAGESTEETPESIKTKYESNDDTNAFTDAEKEKLANLNLENVDFDEKSVYVNSLATIIEDVSVGTNSFKLSLLDTDLVLNVGDKIKIETDEYIIESIDMFDSYMHITLDKNLTTSITSNDTVYKFIEILDNSTIKRLYETNADTNAFTDEYKLKLDTAASSIHNDLTDRDAEDAHPISAITDLQNELDSKVETTDITNAINAHNTDVTAHDGAEERVDTIEGLIPAAASTTNQLADKDFVNSSIISMSANPVTYNAAGSGFPTKADLDTATSYYFGGEDYTPSEHDYTIVLADESAPAPWTGGQVRYTYDGTNWVFQYGVNEEPFTSDEVAAIESGITAELVDKLKDLPGKEYLLLPDYTKQTNIIPYTDTSFFPTTWTSSNASIYGSTFTFAKDGFFRIFVAFTASVAQTQRPAYTIRLNGEIVTESRVSLERTGTTAYRISSELFAVKAGDTIRLGMQLFTVGTLTYSTGAVYHYETRAIEPSFDIFTDKGPIDTEADLPTTADDFDIYHIINENKDVYARNVNGSLIWVDFNSSIESSENAPHFKGEYATLALLKAAHPTAESGDYAVVTDGTTLSLYIWDNTASSWSPISGGGSGDSGSKLFKYSELTVDVVDSLTQFQINKSTSAIQAIMNVGDFIMFENETGKYKITAINMTSIADAECKIIVESAYTSNVVAGAKIACIVDSVILPDLTKNYAELDSTNKVTPTQATKPFVWTDYIVDSVASDNSYFIIDAAYAEVVGTINVNDVLLIDELPYLVLDVISESTKTKVSVTPYV